MLKNKKSAVEFETIIKIILIIISLGIILGAIYILNLNNRIDIETCRASVLARSLPVGEMLTKPAISLRCKTQHVCITMSGNGKGCGVHDYKFQISDLSNDESIIRQIQEEIAGQFYDCWWMLGEGKADFFDESSWKTITGLAKTSNSCVICSVLTFDEQIKQRFPQIDVSSYLEKEKIPGKEQTFLDYFTSSEEDALLTRINEQPTIDTTKEYSITFMGIKAQSMKDILVKDAALLGGATIFTNFLPGGSALLRGAWNIVRAHPVATAIVVASWVGTQGLFTIQSQHAAAAHCDGNTNGCSILILGEYKASELGEVCANIDSIP
jgi:hypothetical protein